MSKLGRNVILGLLLSTVSAYAQSNTAITTVNTDPIWNANVFWTNPPVLSSDVAFVNQVGSAGTTCYAGSTSTNSNCYSSALTGSITILNESASQSFAGIILQPTFASMPTGLSGTIGATGSYGGVALNSGELDSGTSRPDGDTGNTDPLTGSYSGGDFTYIFLRMSDYFGGVNCGSNPNQTNCVLNPNQSVTIPYSFVDLPANVIFNVYAVGTNQSIYDTNNNSSTSGVLASISGFSLGAMEGSGPVPEPGTLLLVSGGILGILRARSRRKRS